MQFEKKDPSRIEEIKHFLDTLDFKLPQDFTDFYEETNGILVSKEEEYFILWPIQNLNEYNKMYKLDKYAPNYFLIGSNGGEMAIVIDKATGEIFALPFIGMEKETPLFLAKTLRELVS